MKLVLDSLDGLDPALAAEYEERDGKFFANIEDDVRKHPKGSAINAIVDRLKAEKKSLTDKINELEAKLAEVPEGFDAEEYARLKDAAAKAKKKSDDHPDDEGAKEQRRLYEQRIAAIEKKHAEALAERDAKITALTQDVEGLVGREGLSKALLRHGVDKKLLPGSMALLMRMVKVRRDEESGEWNADIGDIPIEQYVETWVQSDEGSVYLERPKGGGAEGNNGAKVAANPFIVPQGQQPNLTAQQELIKSNPERARAQAQAAGVTPYW